MGRLVKWYNPHTHPLLTSPQSGQTQLSLSSEGTILLQLPCSTLCAIPLPLST